MTKKILLFLILTVVLFTFGSANTQAALVPCGNGNDPVNACTLCHLIVGIHNIVTWGRNILISVAAIGIFISGILYMISSGNEEMITKSKTFLKNSLIGFTVVLMAWFFVNTVMWILSVNNFSTIGQENWYTFTCSTSLTTNTKPLPSEKYSEIIYIEKLPVLDKNTYKKITY